MKAVRYRRYGSPEVLEVTVADPPAIGDHDVLVRVRAASLNPLDRYFMRGRLSGFLEAGMVVPVIDRTYPPAEVADAMRNLEQGHAQGKIVIAV
jgi:NADPH:quinone reductase-like Zn-dependent oxidoreductase